LVLGRLHDLLVPGGWLVPLVKPQFEVGRADVGKGGIVRDARKIKDAVERVKASAVRCGFLLLGEFESPLKGPKGNKEFFLFLKKSSAGDTREPSLT
jgi:23S rRNA (cytidine1920-2'-O)/16S rRNA (cytidine1409-2'-O)-methyltransferase